MSKNKFEVGFIFGAKKSGTFNKTFSSINQSIKGVVKSVAALASTYAGISAFKSIATSAIESASSLEGYRSTLNVVMKDTKKAAETMKWAVDFANKTPFETDSIVEATVRLQSYGLDATKVMTQIGDMAGVMNKDVMQAVEAVADAQTGELERMKEFGITKAMIQEKANAMFVGQEIINKKGQIVEQEKFNDALFALMEDRFKGGMEIQAESYKGIISTIQGIWKTGLASIAGISQTGEIIDGSAFDEIKGVLQKVSGALQKFSDSGGFEKIGRKIGSWIFVFKEFGAKAKDIVSNVGGWIADKFSIAFIHIREQFGKLLPKINEIKTAAGGIFEKVQPVINWAISDGLPGVVQLIKDVINGVMKLGAFVVDNWNIIQPIMAGIAAGFAAFKTITVIIFAIEKIKTGIMAVKATMKGFSLLRIFFPSKIMLVAVAIGAIVAAIFLVIKNWDKIKPVIDKGVKFAKDAIAKAVESIKNFGRGILEFFSDVWANITGFFAGIGQWGKDTVQNMIQAFSDFGQRVSSFFSGLWTNICDFFTGIGTWAGESVQKIIESFSKIGQGIKDAFQGVGEWFTELWEGIKGTFKSFINFFIKGINWIISGINKISITTPDWLPGDLGGKTLGFNIPEVPMLAKGGIATAPTLAMVGEGSEKEAILPLSKLRDLLGEFAGERKETAFDKLLKICRQPTANLTPAAASGPTQYIYSPVYHLHGSAGKAEVMDADAKNQQDFIAKINYDQELHQRTSFKK